MVMYMEGESLKLFLLYSYSFLALQSTEMGPASQYPCNVYVCFKSSLVSVLKGELKREGKKKRE